MKKKFVLTEKYILLNLRIEILDYCILYFTKKFNVVVCINFVYASLEDDAIIVQWSKQRNLNCIASMEIVLYLFSACVLGVISDSISNLCSCSHMKSHLGKRPEKGSISEYVCAIIATFLSSNKLMHKCV